MLTLDQKEWWYWWQSAVHSTINRRAVLIALVAVRHLFSGFLSESGNLSVISEFGTFSIDTCNIWVNVCDIEIFKE